MTTDREQALRAALAEAVEILRDIVEYVPEFIRRKHGYDETIDALEDLL